MLDDYGGTSLIQVSPSRLTITLGAQHLACVRLTDRNLLRWYASCCGTPIGNTPGAHRLHVLGLIDACLDISTVDVPVAEALGLVRARAFKRFTSGDRSVINAMPGSFWPYALGGIRRILGGILTGAYKVTPFFDDSGRPIAEPHRLTREERSRLPPYAG